MSNTNKISLAIFGICLILSAIHLVCLKKSSEIAQLYAYAGIHQKESHRWNHCEPRALWPENIFDIQFISSNNWIGRQIWCECVLCRCVATTNLKCIIQINVITLYTYKHIKHNAKKGTTNKPTEQHKLPHKRDERKKIKKRRTNFRYFFRFLFLSLSLSFLSLCRFCFGSGECVLHEIHTRKHWAWVMYQTKFLSCLFFSRLCRSLCWDQIRGRHISNCYSGEINNNSLWRNK